MTLATVRRKTERIREFSALPFVLVAAVSIAGARVPAGSRRPSPADRSAPATWPGCSPPPGWSC